MSGRKPSLFHFVALLLSTIFLSSCGITKPFQATIQLSEWDFKADQSGDFFEVDNKCTFGQARQQTAFVLIHGIYGNQDTFGKLPEMLTFHSELKNSSVLLMSYWSSGFLPNFQSLAELGRAFKVRLEEMAICRNPEQIIIVAHSQGGLIAKEAVLTLKERGDTNDLLPRIKLIMLGTPNYFSQYAAYNNLFVNSLFAPITWVSGLFTAGFGKAYVYNRQAFDMADNVNPLKPDFQPTRFHSEFMLNHIAKWGEHFPEGVKENPKIYAIVGVKNLFNDFALSDGIVHSDTLLFAGIPKTRVHYVPYRHFGDLASVDDEHHRTFTAIEEIAKDKDKLTNTPDQEQMLSPFQRLSYANVLFIMEQDGQTTYKGNSREPIAIELESIFVDGDKPSIGDIFQNKYKNFESGVRTDALGSLFKSISMLVFLPFQNLLNLAYPTANRADRNQRELEGDIEAKWKIIRLPEIVLNGSHEGTIRVSRQSSERSWFFGMKKTEYGIVKYAISDENGPSDPCTQEYPIHWGNQTISSDTKPPKIKLAPNAVNYIKVELGTEQAKLTRVGCDQIS